MPAPRFCLQRQDNGYVLWDTTARETVGPVIHDKDLARATAEMRNRVSAPKEDPTPFILPDTVWIPVQPHVCPYCGGGVVLITYPATMDGPAEYDYRCRDCGASNPLETNDGYWLWEVPVSELGQLDPWYRAAAEYQRQWELDLLTPVAPVPFVSPMTPESLSDAVRIVVDRAQSRVGPDSIRAQQSYTPGQPQTFETMDLLGLIDDSTEEALDHINYGVMLTIRLDRLRSRVAEIVRRVNDISPETTP